MSRMVTSDSINCRGSDLSCSSQIQFRSACTLSHLFTQS